MFKKKISYLILAVLIVAQTNPFVINAFAAVTAELKAADPGSITLVKGCPSTINILLNTNGESVLAGDTKFNVTGDATINSVSIGSILPMQTYSQVTGTEIKLSGARFPNTGGFNGNGVFGTINLTPSNNANSVSVTFSPDIVLDNNMVNANIENVLNKVTNATYTVRDKYGGEYCTPDLISPSFMLADPTVNSNGNPANTNVTFIITDDRSGVNISTLQFQINGSTPANPVINGSGGNYQVSVNPDTDFPLGSQVNVTVIKVCDNDGNCLNNQTQSFRIIPPSSCGDGNVDPGEECDDGVNNANMNSCTSSCTTAKCGDGYIWWGQEECDDGNTKSDDGCSSECKLEAGAKIIMGVVTAECPAPEQPAECPVCEVCPECPVCPVYEEIVRVEYIQAEEVSQEEQNTAVETATIIVKETETITKTEYVVNTETNCDAFDFATDSDSDGLSDKMECYLGTDPYNSDTDGDSCNDWAEINQFMTNPLVKDCNQEEKITGTVVITDPQAGWIVPTLKITGSTPKETTMVDVVAFPAEGKLLKNLINELTTVITMNSTQLDKLDMYINELVLFIETYGTSYEYGNLDKAIETLGETLATVKDNGQEADMKILSANLAELQKLEEVSIYLGRSLPKSAGDTMELGTLRFTLEPLDVKLVNGKLYDLVATAKLTNSEEISSVPVRINVDKDIIVKKPIPRYIDGQKIQSEIAYENIFFDNAIAEGNDLIEIKVSSKRPEITGDVEFGSQVFAVWESIVLSSSVISDSDEGSFSIRPPKDLEPNKSHKVTLYALKTADDGRKIRSENVEIKFKIETLRMGAFMLMGIFFLLLLLAVGIVYFASKWKLWLVAKRRKKDEEEKKNNEEIINKFRQR